MSGFYRRLVLLFLLFFSLQVNAVEYSPDLGVSPQFVKPIAESSGMPLALRRIVLAAIKNQVPILEHEERFAFANYSYQRLLDVLGQDAVLLSLLKEGQLQQASTQISKRTQSDKSAPLFYQRGLLFSLQQQHGAAIKAYQRAVSLEGVVQYKLALAEALFFAGQKKKALGVLQGVMSAPLSNEYLGFHRSMLYGYVLAANVERKQALSLLMPLQGEGIYWSLIKNDLIGNLFLDSGNYSQADQYFKKALQINKGVPYREARIYGYQAMLERVSGQSKVAIELFSKALSIERMVYGSGHALVALRLNQLGETWNQLGEYKKAEQAHQKALAIDMAVYGGVSLPVAEDKMLLGKVWLNADQAEKAKSSFSQALDIRRQVLGDKHFKLVMAEFYLGKAQFKLNEIDAAISHYQKALALVSALYGDQHADVARISHHIGLALQLSGKEAEAVPYYEKAIAIDEGFYGKQNALSTVNMRNLGLALQKLGDNEQAAGYFEKALVLDKTDRGEDSAEVADDLSYLGLALNKMGQADKSLAYHKQALRVSKTAYGRDRDNVARDLSAAGNFWRTKGEVDKAVRAYRKALQTNQLKYGEGYPGISIDLNNLAVALYAQDKKEEAAGYLQKAVNEMKGVKMKDQVLMIKKNVGLFNEEMESLK
jgi:tetratricopeptide (TPR) repeat protein